jgi:hypothetical protein
MPLHLRLFHKCGDRHGALASPQTLFECWQFPLAFKLASSFAPINRATRPSVNAIDGSMSGEHVPRGRNASSYLHFLTVVSSGIPNPQGTNAIQPCILAKHKHRFYAATVSTKVMPSCAQHRQRTQVAGLIRMPGCLRHLRYENALYSSTTSDDLMHDPIERPDANCVNLASLSGSRQVRRA